MKRRYICQEDAEPVVTWLNQNAATHDARRLARLIADLQVVCGSVQPLLIRFPPPEEAARFKKKHPRLFNSISPREAVERGLLLNPANWPVVDFGQDMYDTRAVRRVQAALTRYSFRPYILKGGVWSAL
jgi:hypothetical protein